jgi:uncharacterized protein
MADSLSFLVKLNDKVKVGQKLAIQRNTFGEVVAEYASGTVRSRLVAQTQQPSLEFL